MIRRKSIREREPCTYHQQMLREWINQNQHEQRQLGEQPHDESPCWCCCLDCPDLLWYYPPRKGTWWERSASSGLQLMREICGGSPGSPEIRPSS